MILVEAAVSGERGLEARILFARQLVARGHAAVIDERRLPETIDRHQRYELAPLLADVSGLDIGQMLLIGADSLDPETLAALAVQGPAPGVAVTAIGRFADHQARVGTAARLAYALGREVRIVDLATMQPRPLQGNALGPLAADPRALPVAARPHLFVVLPGDAPDEAEMLAPLAALDARADIALTVLAPGKVRGRILGSRHAGLAVLGYGEMPVEAIAARAGILHFAGDSVAGERMAALSMAALSAGRVVIDGTAEGGLAASGAPVLRGPVALAALAAYLDATILPNRAEIARRVGESRWLGALTLGGLERAIGIAAPAVAAVPARAVPAASGARPRTVFLPTNGNGLGHARRCLLVAAALAGTGGGAGAGGAEDCAFAAFPSCVPLIRAAGHDCLPLVQKGAGHDDPQANDLLNHRRLDRLLGPGDRLVFDGGHVFASIRRVIFEKALPAIWIRRGLWQAAQRARSLPGQERFFDRVIVPQEAFDELNDTPALDPRIRAVGPIVAEAPADPAARQALRAALARRYGHPAQRLVVSMLGAGVAADRSAQLQFLCNLIERRPGCLHLIVAWPGARVAPGAYGWANSRVLRTRHALAFAQAADLVVSAAGYNAFHEILYHAIPAILIPQMAPYMDDQERRARAASERGLAETVLAAEFLLLERALARMLDDGGAAALAAALAGAVLPARGTSEAAALIAAEGAAR